MLEEVLKSPVDRTRLNAWSAFLKMIPECEEIIILERLSPPYSPELEQTGRICQAIASYPEFDSAEDSAFYLQSPTGFFIAVYLSGSWITARYSNTIELGLIHSRIEERIARERNTTISR